MRPPSPNRVTLGFGIIPGYSLNNGKHIGVDYSSLPDPFAYAPEDGTVFFYGEAGTCGNNLQIDGATGRVGFCHLETSYVKAGDRVKKGQKVAKIGYTGYVEPPGKDGAHLHTVLYKNGEYVDIRKYITEPFGSEGEEQVTDILTVRILSAYLLGNTGRDAGFGATKDALSGQIDDELQKYVGRPIKDVVWEFYDSEQGKKFREFLYNQAYTGNTDAAQKIEEIKKIVS